VDREVSLVEQAVTDLVAGAAVWRVPSFEVNLFVHEVRYFDRYLSASSKVDQSEAVFVCTIMHTASLPTLAFTSPERIRASRERLLQLLIELIFGLFFLVHVC
jgi:hypothetical protein